MVSHTPAREFPRPSVRTGPLPMTRGAKSAGGARPSPAEPAGEPPCKARVGEFRFSRKLIKRDNHLKIFKPLGHTSKLNDRNALESNARFVYRLRKRSTIDLIVTFSIVFVNRAKLMNKILRIYDKLPKAPRRDSCLWPRPVRLHMFHVLGSASPLIGVAIIAAHVYN